MHFIPDCLQRRGAFVYANLQARKVDTSTRADDGCTLHDVPAGWEVAPWNEDVFEVCKAHAWQSGSLVLADGGSCCTALGDSYAGR